MWADRVIYASYLEWYVYDVLYSSNSCMSVFVYLVTAPENILSMMRVEIAATTMHTQLTTIVH